VICNVVVKGNISRRTFTKAGLASIAATASAPKSVQADDHEIPGWIGKETRQASQTAKLRLVPLVAEHSELTVPQASILDELKKSGQAKRIGYRPFELGRYHPARGIQLTQINDSYYEMRVTEDGTESVNRDTLGVRSVSSSNASPPAEVFSNQDAQLARLLALRHQTVSSRKMDPERARIALTPSASIETELTQNGKARGRPFVVNGKSYKPDPQVSRLAQTINQYDIVEFAESQDLFEEKAHKRADRIINISESPDIQSIITTAINGEYTTDSPSDTYFAVLNRLFESNRAFDDHIASVKIDGDYYEALNRGVVF